MEKIPRMFRWFPDSGRVVVTEFKQTYSNAYVVQTHVIQMQLSCAICVIWSRSLVSSVAIPSSAN